MAREVDVTISATDKTRRGLASAEKNLKKTSKAANGLADRFRNVARTTAAIEGPLGGVAGRLSVMATLLGSVNLGVVALGIAFTAMSAATYSSLKRFAEWEKSTFKINRLLKQTAFASGLAASEIEDLSNTIGRRTLESADDVREASAVLLSFKSIAGDAFKRTMIVASDLAAVVGTDLRSTIVQLGKALEDPATGMSALRRSGVSFTNSQKEMIVAMKESGDVAGAQAAILSILEGQLGGAGAAAGGGLSGAADLVAENWNRMLINFARTGSGDAAAEMLTGLGNVLGWLAHVADPEDNVRVLELTQKIASSQKNLNRLIGSGVHMREESIRIELEIMGALIRERRLHQANIDATKEEIAAAREKGKVAQAAIAEELIAENKLKAAKKQAKIEEKTFEKEKAGAAKFGERLAAEEQKFQTSLLTKGQQEDIYLEERLAKIEGNLASELITKEQAHAQDQVAFSLHNAKQTEISRIEGEKQTENAIKQKELERAALSSALTDISGLMSAQSKRLFNIGKATAIANALINTYQAVTKTMASVPYPWNIPLAIAQAAAGLVQVQNIRAQKPARRHGGAVIGGRSYLVGENGPELFTSPRTGQIINNNTTSNIGGASNVLNVTVIQQKDDPRVIQQIAWDGLLDKMNEEGLRFA